MKHQHLNLEIKAVKNDGFFSGYGSVANNKDAYGDVVMPGAFAKSLQEWQGRSKMPPILWNHNSDSPIGVYSKLQEDDHGLYVEGNLLINDVSKAKETHALMKAGAIDGLSIGYQTIEEHFNSSTKTNELHELKLWEISVVTFPANSEARINTVKSVLDNGELPSLPEFEKFLREAGFSKSQATAVASHGLRQLLRDVANPMAKDISQAINILKGIKND